MFVYLSKKISMPNGIRLRSLAWNSQQGWLACGGDSGLVKVLKLPELGATDEKKKEPFTSAQSNLSMNQTLEGHQGSVLVVSWNENYRKLTSSDERGLIIVWILHKGMWFEEMINNRSKCIVLDMRWSSDGQKICILYGDGHVILGDVDGNRLWGKDMNKPLTHVEWSPDGRLLLFCSREGRCNIHDLSGNFLAPLVIHFSNEDLHSSIVGVDWYNGSEGYGDRSAPALAVSLKSGKIQLMRHELDDEPILVDTKMQIISIKWSPNGEVLGVVGLDQSDSMVQLYSHSGNHLRTLSVPGGGISALAWEGRGLRLALAVDAFVYLANIRADYKWAFFGGNTCVYRFKKKDHDEYSVMFWDIYTGKRYCKYVKSLLSICGQGDHCVLVTMGNDIKQYVLILCNAIGNPIMTKHMTVEPHFLAMNMSFVFVSSENTIFAWNYKSLPQASIGGCESSTSSESDINDSHCFQIDQGKEENGHGKTDEICCICSSEKYLMVGRESGILHRYSLPSLTLESTDLLQCRPQGIELNCNSTQLAVIDLNGVLSFHNLQASFQKEEKMAFDSSECKRKDVWNMKWADDNPDLLAVMEKSRMYIIRGTEPEEPVSCTAYLCKFHDLQIHAVQLDEVMKRPEQVGKEHVFHYETKSLRDTHEILLAVKIQDAFSYVEEHSHPRLWITLAEHALVKLELSIAERAFVKCQNYHGIQFVKGLYSLKDINLQRAEVCFYFKKFDEAEKIYLDMQRMDLAINMRMRLGDWFM